MADEACAIGPPAPAESYLAHGPHRRGGARDRGGGGAPGLRLPRRERRLRGGLRGGRPRRSSDRRPPPSAPWATRSRRGAPPSGSACRWCRARRRPSPTTPRPRAWPRRVGYPVMIKAAMGGGGKGMRLVRAAEASWPARSAPRAARRAGPSATPPSTSSATRGAAAHRDPGARRRRTARVLHLGERECSIQRRHQKLVEESPSPVVDAGAAPAHGRGGLPARRRRRLRQRRHRRVPRRPASAILLPRDEHAPAGRAPGHRAGDGARPRQASSSASPPASRSASARTT